MLHSIFRTDPTNVGDWYCSPSRYFAEIAAPEQDIKSFKVGKGDCVILGGGGLVSANFMPHMERLAACRPGLSAIVAWGIGESLINDKQGGLVPRYEGQLPGYLAEFDLVGLRDHGTPYTWVPCASCMLEHFDRTYTVAHDVCIYEHKRIPIPIEGLPRRSNDGQDIAASLAFLASAEVVITNSYHGAYWATLLGRRVVAIPNLSKMHNFRHAPAISAPADWRQSMSRAVSYPEALEDCREANRQFLERVLALLGSVGCRGA